MCTVTHVHPVIPMRTNINIDDAMMAEVLQITGLPTKRAAVLESLNLLVGVHKQRAFLDLAGKVPWEGDLDAWREGRQFVVDDDAA